VLELQPTVLALLKASVPPEVQAELGSVTPHQLQALSRLPAAGLTMHELAADIGATAATASTLADRLVVQGLAERRADPGDRRLVRLAPSARGEAMVQRFLAARRQAVTALLDRLSDDQLAAWVDILETLAGDPTAPPRSARQGEHLTGAGR
jgi:DNA-binding MarR family transcriptional regulator